MKRTVMTSFDEALAQDAAQVDNDRYQQALNKATREKGRNLNAKELAELREKLKASDAARKFPSYTLAELEKAVASGQGSAEMKEEIANRKSGASTVKVTPQIVPMAGMKPTTKLGRM